MWIDVSLKGESPQVFTVASAESYLLVRVTSETSRAVSAESMSPLSSNICNLGNVNMVQSTHSTCTQTASWGFPDLSATTCTKTATWTNKINNNQLRVSESCDDSMCSMKVDGHCNCDFHTCLLFIIGRLTYLYSGFKNVLTPCSVFMSGCSELEGQFTSSFIHHIKFW